jgi:hypothetical protein
MNYTKYVLYYIIYKYYTKYVRGRAGRPARPRTQHDYHHDTKVKPEAATAVIELLMLGGRTPETCWSVDGRQDNKLKNCCIWMVICLNCTMMHGITNLKFILNMFLSLNSFPSITFKNHVTCDLKCFQLQAPFSLSANPTGLLQDFLKNL